MLVCLVWVPLHGISAAPVKGELACFGVDDLFYGGTPEFELGKFGQAVRSPIGGLESLFLWYPNDANLIPAQGTLSAWVKPSIGASYASVFSNPYLSVFTLIGYRGQIDYGAKQDPDWVALLVERSYPDKEGRLQLGSSKRLKLGEWNHVAVTFRPTETAIFIDGEPVGEGGGVAPRRDADRTFLDKLTDTIRFNCPGLLDEVVLLDRVLTADEVKSLSARTTPYPAGEDTRAMWRFDGDAKMRLPKREKASGGSLFYRTGSAYSLFRDEKGVAIKFNVINWNPTPADWFVKLKVDDMQRKRVYEKAIRVRLTGRSQKQWLQKLEGLANGRFYGTFDLAAKDGTLLDRRVSIFGKTLAPDRSKIPEDARFQVGAESYTYCNWPDNGMTFSLMRHSNWADVEPEKGKWSWTLLDEYVKQAHEDNVHFVLGSASCPPWAVKEGHQWAAGNWEMRPKDAGDFSTYVETLARRYNGKARYFEVCNEPGYLSPSEYADFVVRAKKAVQKVGADLKVIANWHTSQQWLDQVVAKARDSIDILSVHPYITLTLENEEDSYPFYLGMLPRLRSLGMNGPLWGTEAGNWGGHLRSDGYPMTREDEKRFRDQDPGRKNLSMEYFNSQEDLANMAARSMVVSFASGLERYSWHYFRAMVPCDSIPSYHLLVFGNIAGLLTGGEYVRQLDLGGSDLWAFQFRNNRQTIIAYWQAMKVESPRKAYFRVNTATCKVTDIYGNSKEYRSLAGVAEVEVTGVPHFLRTDAKDIGVSKPVLALRASGVILPGVESKVAAQICNPLPGLLTGRLTLKVPAGVKLAPAEYPFSLKPGEEQKFESSLLIPVGLGVMAKQVHAKMQTQRLGVVERTLALQVRQSTKCARSKGEVRIDGRLEDWADLPTIELNRESQVILGTVRPEGDPNPALHFEWDGPEDLSGVVRTAWDESNLCLGIEVKDKGLLANAPRKLGNQQAQYEGDCVEVFLDFEEKEGKGYGPNTWQIYFVPPTDDFPSISWFVFQPAAKELVGVQAVGKTSEDAYGIEAKIPWVNFAPFKPSTGKVIGFDLAIDDQDSAEEQVHSFGKGYRKCQLGWGENKAFSGDRSQFGRMILAD